jgi:DNA-binding response OmpR family regulator
VDYTNPPVVSYLPTLVLDANAATASLLAAQLSHHGFRADIATSCSAAHAALRRQHYASVVAVADLSRSTDLQCLAELRTRSPRTWIIVIGSDPPHDAERLIWRHGADALLLAPFSVEHVISRLRAFSLRSRPC